MADQGRMSNYYDQQVRMVIQATVFHSATRYSWFGEASPQLPVRIKRALTPNTARSYLLHQLQSQLYSDFYLRGFAGSKAWETVDTALGRAPFVAALSVANMGSGYCDSGWEVRASAEREVIVRRDGLELWVRPEDCSVPGDGPITTGMRLRLRFPKEFLSISPGFYLALSDQELKYDNTQPLVRLYWNLTAEGAVPFVRAATARLNRAQLAFKLKVLNHPSLFTRCDAAVVYLLKSDYPAVASVLGCVYPEVSPYLKPGTPALTKPVAPGVGFVEDPGREESFGQHRCRIIADGMIRAYEQGAKSIDERGQIVINRFAEEGICLNSPYLNPGSSDDYKFQVASSE
jgi:hypothetical protein